MNKSCKVLHFSLSSKFPVSPTISNKNSLCKSGVFFNTQFQGQDLNKSCKVLHFSLSSKLPVSPTISNTTLATPLWKLDYLLIWILLFMLIFCSHFLARKNIVQNALKFFYPPQTLQGTPPLLSASFLSILIQFTVHFFANLHHN